LITIFIAISIDLIIERNKKLENTDDEAISERN